MLSLLQALAKILLLNNIIASHFSPQIKKIFSTGFTQSLLSLIFIVGLLGKFFFFYDGLGRRIQTKSQGNTINYYYDPEVEFLELGHSVNGNRQWNLHGPDRSGVYGGAQGIGGLESCFTENTKTSVGIVNNYFGDVVGLLSSGTFTPYPSALGAYGPMPGSSVDQALQPQWRGHYLDPTGFYYMGARYYDPQGGRFISPDPLGHSSSLGLYDYCNGDPVNGLDPDGRCVEGASAGWANGNGQFAGTYDSSQASSQLAYGLGWTVGGALGTVNGMAASLITRPLAAMGQSFNEVTNFAEENLNLAPGSLTAATFMFAPLAVAGEVAGGIEEADVVSKTKPLLRQAYETDVQNLKGVSLSARASGQDAESTARMAYTERNTLKLQYRELTPANLLEKMEQRNIKKYQNPLGPTIENLRSRGKTWEQIIESASRPGGSDFGF